MHPYIIRVLPKGAAFAIFSYIPDAGWGLDNVENFENVLVLYSPQLLVDSLLFLNILALAQIPVDPTDGQVGLWFSIEHSENLLKTKWTWAKFPSPISSALLTSNSFLKCDELTIILNNLIIYSKLPFFLHIRIERRQIRKCIYVSEMRDCIYKSSIYNHSFIIYHKINERGRGWKGCQESVAYLACGQENL